MVQFTIQASEILSNKKFYSIESSISPPFLFRITFFLNKNTPYPTPQSFTVRIPLTIFIYNLKLLLVIAIGVCQQSLVVPKVTFYPQLIFILNVPLAPLRSTQVQNYQMDVRSGVRSESSERILLALNLWLSSQMCIAYWHWQLICPIINYKKIKFVGFGYTIFY